MVISRYPPEVHEFVKEWSRKLRDQELAEMCTETPGTNFTAKTMKSFRGNHGYRNYQKKFTSEEYWKYQTRYPKGMFEYIRDNSWGVSSKEMAEQVNAKFGTSFTQTGMKQFRKRHGIKSGCTGWFQKEHPPGTKGEKQEEYMSPEAIERTKATRFKKGDRPKNEVPVGTIRKNKYGYLLRKKQMAGSQWERWEFLHRAVWEEHNGKIPEGMMVIFKDSDRKNCDISNLMLVTKGEGTAMARKKLRFKNPDLTETALQLVRLSIAANRRRKGRNENDKEDTDLKTSEEKA